MNNQKYNSLATTSKKLFITGCFLSTLVFTSVNLNAAPVPCTTANAGDKNSKCCGNGVLDPDEVCDIGITKNGADLIYQGPDLNGSADGDGRPDYGCNATCTAVNEGWKCNGYNASFDTMKGDYDALYDYMIALYQDIRTFSQNDANFSATDPNSCRQRSSKTECVDYETKLSVFMAANRHQPITCVTKATLSTPVMDRLRYRDGQIDAIKVNFEPGC